MNYSNRQELDIHAIVLAVKYGTALGGRCCARFRGHGGAEDSISPGTIVAAGWQKSQARPGIYSATDMCHEKRTRRSERAHPSPLIYRGRLSRSTDI